MLLFKSVACLMVLLSLGLIGCGKKEDDLGTKIIKTAGKEVVGRLTGEFKRTAELARSYDHALLEKAVNNPNGSGRRYAAKKVLGQLEDISGGILKELFKSREELEKTMQTGYDVSFMNQVEKDKREGKDISKNFIFIEQKKFLAFMLSSELTDNVGSVCRAILDGNDSNINLLWQEVVQSRERVDNFIEGKPVTYSNTTNGKGSFVNNKSSTKNEASGSNMRDAALFGAMDKLFLGKWRLDNPHFPKDPSSITIKEANPQTGGYEVEIFFYRIADVKGHAAINGNKLAFTEDNKEYNINGTIEKVGSGIRLTITKSDFEYIKSGSVHEYKKN